MRSILLAEDEFLIRSAAASTFADAGYRCLEAPTGKAAIELLARERPLHAIIVDVGLPDMSGEAVIARARELHPDTPIIRCSGTTSDAKADGNIHVFNKPYAPGDLCRFVTSLIGP